MYLISVYHHNIKRLLFVLLFMAGLFPLAVSAQDGNAFDFLPSLPESDEIRQEESAVLQQTKQELEEELRRESFENAVDSILPLRPGEIKELLTRFDQTQQAVNEPVIDLPKPQMVVETLSLDPGSTPAVIKVAYGYVTTLNIVDSTGAPWPIEDITWAGNFEVVEVSDDGSSHFVRIAPQSEYARGNISIHMLGLQTPVIVSMETSRDVVHYRFDAIIPEAGPLAKASIIDAGITTVAGDVDTTRLLEGVVPEGATRLGVSGVDGRTSAYLYNGMTYLRTPYNLLSPAWEASSSSADGMRVYLLKSAPVVLLSRAGQTVRARLTERKDIFDD